jgi:hypothetical protein
MRTPTIEAELEATNGGYVEREKVLGSFVPEDLYWEEYYCLYEPLPRPDGVIRSSVLPGFQFRMRDLYDQPDPSHLIHDPVYMSYISPRVCAERQLVEWERQRAEQAEAQLQGERRRNEQERRRNELLANLLRLAGIIPPD